MKHIAAGLLMSLALGSAWSDSIQRGDFLHAPDRIAWHVGGLYDGRFEDGTHFQIEIAYPRPAGLPERAPPFAESYWYPKHTTGEAFRLRDAGSSGNTLRLALETDTGKSAEENFAIALAADKLTGSGTWNSSRLHKQMRFTLQRAIVYDGVVVTRPAPPEAHAEDPTRRFMFTSYFPVLGNGAVDTWIGERAAACSDDLECINDVRVRWKSAALLSLDANDWGYSYSAAHGNGGSTTRQYRIGAKGFVPLVLSDFVKLDAACDSKVRTAMAVQLRAKGFPQGADSIQGAPLAPDTTLKFTPTASGIAFHFDPYEVGSYAQGAPSIFVTRAQMGACARELPTDD